MLYREIIAVCSEIHTRHTYTYDVWAESGNLAVCPATAVFLNAIIIL
jgi:hypothetical protein